MSKGKTKKQSAKHKTHDSDDDSGDENWEFNTL